MIDTTVAIVSVIIGIVTFVITFRWAVFTYKNQMNSQLFMEFTKRYNEIMESYPAYARSSRLDSQGPPPKESEELSLSVLRYLNLCGEEYYMYTKELLDERLWRIWRDELNLSLQSPLVVREWKKLKREFDTYKEFQVYVDKQQRQTAPEKTIG